MKKLLLVSGLLAIGAAQAAPLTAQQKEAQSLQQWPATILAENVLEFNTSAEKRKNLLEVGVSADFKKKWMEQAEAAKAYLNKYSRSFVKFGSQSDSTKRIGDLVQVLSDYITSGLDRGAAEYATQKKAGSKIDFAKLYKAASIEMFTIWALWLDTKANPSLEALKKDKQITQDEYQLAKNWFSVLEEVLKKIIKDYAILQGKQA